MKLISCGFPNQNSGPTGSQLLVALGPTMQVEIGFDPAWSADQSHQPNLPMKGVNALVDTGATDSCIDTILATTLNLPIIDQRKVSGVGGTIVVNMHIAQIHIPTLPHTLFGSFAGVNLSAGGQPHVVLIGRTFLQHFHMWYDGKTGNVHIFDEMPNVQNQNPAPAP